MDNFTVINLMILTYCIMREVQAPGIRGQEVRHMLYPSSGADHGGHSRVTGTLGRAHTSQGVGEQQHQQR